MKQPTPARSAPSPRSTWALAAVAALIAATTFWNSLHYGLAQDAFVWIARARGLLPHTTGLWRTLSYDVYYRLIDAAFGLDARPYRVVILALHAANAALVMLLGLRLGLSKAAAFAATMFFAVHYANFDAIFAVGSISEPMAAFGVLLSLWIALPESDHAGGRFRVIAVTLAFIAALLSKETVLLFPAVLWLATRSWPNGARGAVIPCAAASALFLIQFWITDPIGILRSAPGANPYEAHWGAALLQSWTTYFSWAFHVVHLLEADLHDRVANHPEGWWWTFAWLVGCASVFLAGRRLRDLDPRWRTVALGAAIYGAFIAPVLPLATHAFHLYLYLPLVGLAWSLAATWDAWVSRRANALAWVVAAALVVQGFITVRGMEVVPLRETQLPFMGSVRRALVANRLLEGLSDARTPLPESLALIGPDGLSPPTRPDTTSLGAFLFNDVAGAIDQGRAVRLRFRQVREVELFGDLGPWLRTPDVAVFDYSGHVLRGPAAWLYLRRAQVEWEAGRIPTAAAAMASADTMTQRWRAEVNGSWRDEGLRGIRQQAGGMLDEEGRANRAPSDPRAAARPGYLHAVARVAEIARGD